jgi:hypothetical protein
VVLKFVAVETLVPVASVVAVDTDVDPVVKNAVVVLYAVVVEMLVPVDSVVAVDLVVDAEVPTRVLNDVVVL